MSFLGAQNSIALGVQGIIAIDTGVVGSADYLLAKSLRFRSSASAYLNRTVSAAVSTYTVSMWVKRGTLTSTYQYLFSHLNSGNTDGYGLAFNITTDTLYYYNGTAQATTAAYRDPAAWYHIVFSNNAGSFTIYVNGVSVKTGTATAIPSGAVMNLGRYGFSSTFYFDGELAEINFVDGQALAPTAFGASSIYNQWLPIKYAGTYGTNGFYLPFNATSATSYAGSFNGTSQYLSATPATIGSSAFWVEGWLNTSNITTTKFPISLGYDANNSLQINIDTNLLRLQVTNNSGGSALSNVTMGTLTANTWVYFYFGRGADSGGTATWYYGINGSITSAVVTTNPTFPSRAFEIGYAATRALAGSYYSGYMSNVRLVVGVIPNTANFTPPVAPLTAITGTAFLTLQSATIVDNSGNSVAITNNGTVVTSVQYPFSIAVFNDSSGNANNWTPNNISLTAGSTYDSLTDVPTLTSETVANYAVMNPIALNGSATLSSANLLATLGATSADFVSSTIGCSGKNYIEFKGNSFGSGYLSFCVSNIAQTQGVFYRSDGTPIVNGSSTTGIASFTTSDTIAITVDTSTRAINLYKNNVQVGTTYTASGTDNLFVLISGSGLGSGSTSAYVNFGQQPFTYTAPTGFLPLNTFNIAAGTVTTSGTFTGNASTNGPMVYLNGTPTAMTINGNAVTFGTHADKLANGFKVRSSSASYNASGSNTYVATTVGAVFKYEDAQANP